VNSPLFELARLLVRRDHVASTNVTAGSLRQSERFRCFAQPIALLAGLDLSGRIETEQ
jgi:hypothetical protein